MATVKCNTSNSPRFGGILRQSRLGIAAVLFLAPLAWPQANPAGHWEGTVNLPTQAPGTTTTTTPLGLTLDLAQNAKSEWEASMGFPADNLTGGVVTDLTVDGSSVRFVAVELAMAKVDLTLGPEGIMKGTIALPPGPRAAPPEALRFPIEFKRTGEAKVELIAPSPAVSKEFEGAWEGTLLPPGGQPTGGLPVVFRFKNQPDGTVAATMDSPARNAMNMPLDHVKQAGQTLEFGLKIAHASFHGTLNKEGTEISGQFSHQDQGVPLTLRKK